MNLCVVDRCGFANCLRWLLDSAMYHWIVIINILKQLVRTRTD